MKSLHVFALSFLLVFSSTSAFAQQSDALQNGQAALTIEQGASEVESPIIVIGEKEAEERVADYIDSAIAVPRGGRFEGQYARLNSPVCPGIYGFSPDLNKAIADRITAVAKASDIRVAKSKCQPNVFVVAVTKGENMVELLRKKHPRIFGTLPLDQRDRLENSEGPDFRWQIRQAISAASGGLVDRVTQSGLGPDLQNLFGNDVPTNPVFRATRLRSPTIEEISASFMLLEMDALLGMTSTQIADYAAVSLLLEVTSSQRDKKIEGSILSLFDDKKNGRELPQSVSEWDLMMLNAWYTISPDRFATQQESALRFVVLREIKQSSTN